MIEHLTMTTHIYYDDMPTFELMKILLMHSLGYCVYILGLFEPFK